MKTRTRTELMADMIVKADWLIMSPKTDHYGNYSSEYKTAFDEYCRLRAELAEVKERSAEEVLYDTTGMLGENHPSIIKAMHEFTSQSSKMPTEEIKKALQIAEYAPELNMANYDDDQVNELNNAMIELCHILRGITESGSNKN